MPRGDFNVYFASRGGPHVRTEVAAGIALLVFILAALLILGCWYFRRCGYKMIRVRLVQHLHGQGAHTSCSPVVFFSSRVFLPTEPKIRVPARIQWKTVQRGRSHSRKQDGPQ
uniref:Melan-A n=1 Tax=Oncorhynchus tshawytscha TaxID=74940 RepID=A0A8C8H6B1_ONCTS